LCCTTTDTGLKVRAEIDTRKYPRGVKVSDAGTAAVNLSRHAFHGDWNYTISPRARVSTPSRRQKAMAVGENVPESQGVFDSAIDHDPAGDRADHDWSHLP
jgi:hypothetical protein